MRRHSTFYCFLAGISNIATLPALLTCALMIISEAGLVDTLFLFISATLTSASISLDQHLVNTEWERRVGPLRRALNNIRAPSGTTFLSLVKYEKDRMYAIVT